MSLLERCKSLFEHARQGTTHLPTRVAVPADHVDNPVRLGSALVPNQSYFQVRVNEMFLSHSRDWFAKYDPLVFVGSEFIYDKEEAALPFVLGPSLLERFGKGQDSPAGMVFEDTRVAGLHPYRGGRLAITVILYRIQRANYAREILKLMDATVGALDFSTAVATYTKIAGVALDGVEALLGLGTADALVGYRRELDPDAGDDMGGGYFALIDAPEDQFQPERLWVRKGRLVEGTRNDDTAKPFRSADYLLYSLASTPARTDERKLPFFPLWQRVEQEAAVPTKDGWESAKGNMLSLYQTLMLSPDLTKSQADRFVDEYAAAMKDRHERAIKLSSLGDRELRDDAEPRPAVTDGVRQQSIGILAM